MTTNIFDSNQARLRWRDLLDIARAGEDTIIEHYNKPTAALIPYDDYVALQEELDDLRATRRAELAYQGWERDRASARPYSAIRAELMQDGLLAPDK